LRRVNWLEMGRGLILPEGEREMVPHWARKFVGQGDAKKRERKVLGKVNDAQNGNL